MIYLNTNYYDFIGEQLNEATGTVQSTPIDYDKINCLKLKMKNLSKRLTAEKDFNTRRRLQMEIKVCELKIMIAKI